MGRTATYSTPTGWFVMKFAFTSIHGPQRMKPTGTSSVFFCKITVKLTVFWLKQRLNEMPKNLVHTVHSWCTEDDPYCLWQFWSCAKFALIQWNGSNPQTLFGLWHILNRYSWSPQDELSYISIYWMSCQWTLVQTVIVTRGWRLLTLSIPIVMPKHHYMVDILDF